MAERKRLLIISQEIFPYTDLTEISQIAAKLPQFMQDKAGYEIRVLMPRYGVINERRHRLHEVVRLSGMNIIVDDDDYPLIIKVASMPNSRLQVYYLENEDYFKRKFIFEDDNGKPFEDNQERMVFFCKGVIEIVKKFGWPPDIVHCLGWMTSLIPCYLKTAYKTEPIFRNSHSVYSLHNCSYDKHFTELFFQKAAINNLSKKDVEGFRGPDGGANLNLGGIRYSDAIIKGEEIDDEAVNDELAKMEKPMLQHPDMDTFLEAYKEFFSSLLATEVAA